MQKVGLVTEVTVIGKKRVKIMAKFDTGAMRTSIDSALARKAGLGKTIGTASYSSASNKTHSRKIKKAKLRIGSNTYSVTANITNRDHMKYKVLIGRDLILGNFVIDISKTHIGPKETDFKP